MPERLRELYEALGNDSFLIQECLARPILVSRRTQSFFATDARIHSGARLEAETLRQQLGSGGTISLGRVHVLATGQIGTSYFEGSNGPFPKVGSVFFYLVQYREGQNTSGWGTESSPWPAVPSSCDIGCRGESLPPSLR